VRDGVIERIDPGIAADDVEVVDVSGCPVLLGLVDAHCHLEETL
jgi:dihydroorotase-like cyclic amidohydrolase